MKSTWRETFTSPAALLCFFGTFVIGLSADLVSKSMAVEHLQFGQSQIVLPHVARLEYTENRGAVFGLGQGQRSLFLVVSVAAIAFLVYLFATSGRSRMYQ